jgi:hypothetical protein
VSICTNLPTIQYGTSTPCPDGTIYVAMQPGSATAFLCSPFDLGVLFAKNDATNRVRYADMGSWTGEALPLPATCPTVEGVEICGGNCGGCSSAGDVCTGRSPLHPFGFCTAREPSYCDAGVPHCDPDDGTNGCMTFTVDPAAQPEANRYGLCVSLALCQSLAAGLPGGASCTP